VETPELPSLTTVPRLKPVVIINDVLMTSEATVKNFYSNIHVGL
jgi:hypothetical protein